MANKVKYTPSGKPVKKLHHHRSRGGERELDVGKSTCIDEAFYSKKDQLLTVTFMSGGTYQFGNVDADTAKDVEDGGGEALNEEVL